MFIVEMFEGQGKRLVVTYPGRFQPFHKGHRDVFASLQAKFGNDNVFIVTGDKTDTNKSPFNFNDKVQFMNAAGVNAHSIIEAAKVYDLPDQFKSNSEDIIFVTAVGEPDAKRLNPGSIKKDGNPSYFQQFPADGDLSKLETADKHGYVIIAHERPEVIKIGSNTVDVSHGTPTRALWNEIRNDEKLRGEFLMQLYGRNDPELGRILDKIPQAVNEEAAGVGVVKNGNDPRYVMATTGDDNDVTAATLEKMMRAYHLIGTKKVTPKNESTLHKYKRDRFKTLDQREQEEEAILKQAMNKIQSNESDSFNGEYDDEAGMAQSNLHTIARAAQGLIDTIDDNENLPEWAQEKLAKVEGMLVSVWDYLLSQEEQGIDPKIDEMFDEVEDMVESLAAEHGIDSEAVWESLESVSDQKLIETAAWRRKEGKNKNGGLNAKGVASYRRENPGSKLQTAVTTKPSKLKKGSKAAKRRKSFCARMSGVKGPMKKPNGKPTRKALALRKWNCESTEQTVQMLESISRELSEMKQRLDPKCWKGYKKQGTKVKDGVRVNNCVKMDESALKDMDDYKAKKKALQDIQLDPQTHKDPQLKAELAKRKADLEKEAKAKGYVAEGLPKNDKDEFKRQALLVKDRKTGKLYDPNKEFDKKMKSPEVMAQMKRMAAKEGVAEGGVDTGNMPVAARPAVKAGSLVKAQGLDGVWRVDSIRGDNASITMERPNTGVSRNIPISALRVWTNKPVVRGQGVAENYDEDEDSEQGFFVALGSEDDGGFVGMIVKDGGKWREVQVSGNAPYNWGGSYMGYLQPEDVMSWIRRDYRNSDVAGPFSDEESAMEYASRQYGLDESLRENAEELNIGDDVIITGPVEFKGKTGVISDFGEMKRFVVVDLYNHGKHSFHSSDVSFNEYADSEEEESDLDRDFYEGMYEFNSEDPYNSEFAPSVGMGRMTLRGWKQSLIRRVKQLSAELETAGQQIDNADLWDRVYAKLKSANLDPVAQEIELAHKELEGIRRKGGTRSRAFKKG